jgi:thioredoxin
MKPTEFSIPGVAPVAKPAGGNPHVVNVTEATFATEVVERSKQVPVVVDLWAEWCAPCRQLGPVLERLAAEGNGSWVLAKVDVDANPRIAQALRVQGIPAVKAIVNADLVDEFTGALPEAQVREWLARLGVGADTADVAGDDRLVAALAAERRGDLDDALGTYRAVLADAPADPAAKAGVARARRRRAPGPRRRGAGRRRRCRRAGRPRPRGRAAARGVRPAGRPGPPHLRPGTRGGAATTDRAVRRAAARGRHRRQRASRPGERIVLTTSRSSGCAPRSSRSTVSGMRQLG